MPAAKKPVAKLPAAKKPVAKLPAAPALTPIVIMGKLSPNYVGLKLKPMGVAFFNTHTIRHRKRWEGQLAKRQNLFAKQNTWGAKRLRHFSGKCLKLDASLILKYDRETDLLAKKHKTYLAKMHKKF
jgi:hypothetical protein